MRSATLLGSGSPVVLCHVALLGAALLSGCGQSPERPFVTSPDSGFNGMVHGGEQPVSGATIQLYAVGTAGDGSAAKALITSTTVTTDASGAFNITGLYKCPTNASLVYLVASGGNPGLTTGTNNSAINLMAVLGKCSTLSSTTLVLINEITTVAAVAALAPYTTSATAVGSGTSDTAGLSNDFTLATEYANVATGSTPGSGVPAGDSVPTQQIATLADMIASCVSSGGGVAGDSSPCGNLFTYSTPSGGGSAPTDVVTALLNIFNNPGSNIENLLGLVTANEPFQPALSVPPPNWSVALTTTSPTLSVSSTGISFAATQPGYGASTQTFTLSNSGSTTITVSGFTVAGANAGDFSVSSIYPASLLPGEVCPMTVMFLPTASGTRYADVAITSSASISPIYVPLSGASTASSTAQVSFTTPALTVPSRSNFAGINMQLFSTGVPYTDAKMQADANLMDLGWVRFPAGTADDPYNWQTGLTPTAWVNEFSSFTSGSDPYSTMQTDEEIVGGKGGINLSDFATFIGTQRTGSTTTAGSSSTHVIGVINTFTDPNTSTSAAGLAQAAQQTYGIPVDLWELGNEPSYFNTGVFNFTNATQYLGLVAPYSSAIKAAVPGTQVAVWVPPSITDSWTTLTAGYSPQFWDQLYTHSYPNASTSLTNEGISSPTNDEQIWFYNGFLLNNTNSLVDAQYTPLFGNNMQIEWSEFNTNTLSATLYNAVYIAEFTMRLSSDSHVTHAGAHMLVGASTAAQVAIGDTNDDVTTCEADYFLNKTCNTSTYNFGYYFTAPGLALQIIDGVINTSTGVLPTTVSNSATTSYYNGSSTTASSMPAIYAQAYSSPNNIYHVLLTNKSAGSQAVTILQNGSAVTQTLTIREISGTNAEATNTSSSQNTVTLTTTTTGGPIMLMGYSVVDVSWTH